MSWPRAWHDLMIAARVPALPRLTLTLTFPAPLPTSRQQKGVITVLKSRIRKSLEVVVSKDPLISWNNFVNTVTVAFKTKHAPLDELRTGTNARPEKWTKQVIYNSETIEHPSHLPFSSETPYRFCLFFKRVMKPSESAQVCDETVFADKN